MIDDRVVVVVPVVRGRGGRVAGAGLGRVAQQRRAEVVPGQQPRRARRRRAPRRRAAGGCTRRRSPGGSLPFISAGIAPSRVSARKLSTMSAARAGPDRDRVARPHPASCSQAARAATRSSSWPRVSGCPAGWPSTAVSKVSPGPSGSAPCASTRASTLPAPSSGRRPDAPRSPVVLIDLLLPQTAPRPPRWTCRRAPVRSGPATPRRRRRRTAAVPPRRRPRPVGPRSGSGNHRAVQSPARGDVPGHAVRHRLEEEQRTDPPARRRRWPARAPRWPGRHSALTSTIAVRMPAGTGGVPYRRRRHRSATAATGRREPRVHEPRHPGRRPLVPRLRPPRLRKPPRSRPRPRPRRSCGLRRRAGRCVGFVGTESARSRGGGGVAGHGAPTRRAVLAPPKAAFRLSAYGVVAGRGASVMTSSGQASSGPSQPALTGSVPSPQGEHGDHQFEQAGRLQRVAVQRLGGADRHPGGVLAEGQPQRGRLGGVAVPGAGGVGVDVADRLGRQSGPAQRRRRPPGPARGPAGRAGRGGTRRRPAPSRPRWPAGRRPGGRPPRRLQHHRGHPVAEQQPLPAGAERADRAVGGERPAGVEERELVRLDEVAGRRPRPDPRRPGAISAAASATAVLADTQAVV